MTPKTTGEICYCDRCGDPCRVAPDRNPNAKMLRHAKVPKGNCINCAVAEWFVVTGLRETTEPKELLLPHIQTPFAVIMKMSKADGTPAEINWSKVVANWSLPFHTGKRKPESFPVFNPDDWRDRINMARRRDDDGGDVLPLFGRRPKGG